MLVYLIVLYDAVELNVKCDKGEDKVKEGNIGQSPWFPWVGILRVHSHFNHSFAIGLTGVVLVKEKFALANAMDIAKIPPATLKEDSKVMFIHDQNNPVFCQVEDQVIHPEYDVSTYQTIAILTLANMGPISDLPPICWPTSNFNTSNELYLIGFTDENKLLEKTMIRLSYVDKNLCFEFYKRSNLTRADLSEPVTYLCGFGLTSRKDCEWETGRVVASNASGAWTLVGLLVGGPGCASPARFLDTTAYMPWIITSMTFDDTPGGNDWDFRRSAYGSQNKPAKTNEEK